MPNIYTGDIKNMYISNFELRDKNIRNLIDNNFKFNFGEILVEKDSEFYSNIFHIIVNFRYDEVLADRQEAIGYLKDVFYESKNSLVNYIRDNNLNTEDKVCDILLNRFNSSVLFVDYNQLKFRSVIDRKTLKEKKNIYKLYK